MKTYVLLLRGVMPTGKNGAPMAELRGALMDAGLATNDGIWLDIGVLYATGTRVIR